MPPSLYHVVTWLRGDPRIVGRDMVNSGMTDKLTKLRRQLRQRTTDGAQKQPAEGASAELRAHHTRQAEADLRREIALGEADAAAGHLTTYQPGALATRMKAALARR